MDSDYNSRPYLLTVRKWTMLTHRWMGLAFCLLFLAWFISGIVMMYCGFPQVNDADRLSRASALNPKQIRVTPGQAFAALGASGTPSQVRLNLLDGRPAYRFFFGQQDYISFADSGERLDSIPQEMALRVASEWTGLPAGNASFERLITKVDQWTVSSSVRPYGPFWKFSWPNGEEVYVSQSSGEVVQDTTPKTRLGAYFGAIPHWIYFTPLRSHGRVWNQVVIWLSGAGTVMSVLGLVAGIWLYSPSKKYRFHSGVSAIPFAGNKHWHVVLGLIFGTVTCTWIFSGFMSMDPIPWFSEPEQPNLDRVLFESRVDLAKYADKQPQDAILTVASELKVKELQFASFAGTPFFLATEAPGNSRIIPIQGDSRSAFGIDQVTQVVAKAGYPSSIASSRLVNEYEIYYVDRQKQLPLPVVYVELNDAARSGYYIDPRTGRVIESYGTRSRWTRWLYHGLHSMDLPWLYERRPAWDILVIGLLLGGTALSVTSLLIGWKVVRRKFMPRQRQLQEVA